MSIEAAIAAAAEAAPVMKKPVIVVPGRSVHIDGDYLAYYVGAPDMSAGIARDTARKIIQKFKDTVGAEKAVVHSTARGCHKGERFLAATIKPYQGNRTSKDKPVNLEYMQEWINTYEGPDLRSKVWSSREADDGMAACAYYGAKRGDLVAVATADKDMRMFPGLHIDWKTYDVTEVPLGTYSIVGNNGKIYGLKWFWLQMLMGDTADNCPGLEYIFAPVVPHKPDRMMTIGPKRAEELLRDYETSDEAGDAVIAMYRATYKGMRCQGFPEDRYRYANDRFVEQASLMWMRLGNEASPIDFMDHIGHIFDDEMKDAVIRLDERIKEGRAALNNLQAV